MMNMLCYYFDACSYFCDCTASNRNAGRFLQETTHCDTFLCLQDVEASKTLLLFLQSRHLNILRRGWVGVRVEHCYNLGAPPGGGDALDAWRLFDAIVFFL